MADKKTTGYSLTDQEKANYLIYKQLREILLKMNKYNDFLYINAYQISEILFFIQTGHYKFISRLLVDQAQKRLEKKKL